MTGTLQQDGEGKPLPLAGLRVVDFGWVWSVPVIGRILADMGSEVIKVESRNRLDTGRTGLPVGDRPADPDWAVGFHVYHRNKQSVTANLRSEEGLALIKRPISVSDVVMSNMTPGVMDRLGLGYDDLKQVRADLAVLTVSTIGQTGPFSQTPSYSPCAGAISGLETLVGYEGGSTQGSTTAFMDPITALYRAFAILIALEHRTKTGDGQYIDASLTEAGIAFTVEPLLDYQWNSRIRGPRGNMEPGYAPHNTCPCLESDSWIGIAVASETEWQNLLEVMSHPSWVHDPRFADQFSRWKHRDALDQLMGQWTVSQERDELARRLQAAGVAATPAYSLPELPSLEHHQHRQDYVTLDHPTLANELIYSVVWPLSETPGSIRRHAPLLGEHNSQVYRNLLGLSAEELRQLEESGALYWARNGHRPSLRT